MDANSADPYELLDFGRGAKLERFGPFTIQRPCPAAERHAPKRPDFWREIDATFQRDARGQYRWTVPSNVPDTWTIDWDGLTLRLRRTATGQLGIFPEQRANWRWLDRQVQRAGRPLQVLNLFAYTGASTLACAAAGAHVTHVDAAKSAVTWAKANAKLVDLPEDRVSWVVEDARKFIKRQIRRGRRYDAVILDPPSYGHGPRKEPWKIEAHLPELLADCRLVLTDPPTFVLVSCHSPSFGRAELQAATDSFLFHTCAAGSRADELTLRTVAGRELPAGVVVRWPGKIS